ncbi:MAG TPA: single-stranded DNA-binding protein [Candidatus Cloacimonetes bacterium]|nr:single-stranded DNA-binding protein [Candidatus Cloacimonadota bacterium]
MAHELRFPRINSVVLSGRLTRDVELRYTPNGTPVAKLSLAFNRVYQKDGEWQEETGFIDVVVWSRRAEQCAEYLHKGSPVVVEGYIKTRTYQDKENQNRKITEIVSSRVHFLERTEIKTEESTPKTEPEISETKENIKATVTDDDVPF